MDEQPSGLALLFSAGRFRGGEFPLPAGRDVMLGRDASNELHLDEDGVSRVHAKLTVREDGVLQLRDMHSTNGTFVNGERVQSALLREGDKILVGHSIMTVVRDQGFAA